MVALAGAGAGVAMVPRLALRGTDLSGVVIRPVEGPQRRVFAAVRRGAERHPLLVPLLDALHLAAAALRHAPRHDGAREGRRSRFRAAPRNSAPRDSTLPPPNPSGR
nr:hypothetical protein GCM10020093_065760 [Planobispora longispora]